MRHPVGLRGPEYEAAENSAPQQTLLGKSLLELHIINKELSEIERRLGALRDRVHGPSPVNADLVKGSPVAPSLWSEIENAQGDVNSKIAAILRLVSVMEEIA